MRSTTVMRIPATEEAFAELDHAMRECGPREQPRYRPNLLPGSPCFVVLPPHAWDIYGALKWQDLLAKAQVLGGEKAGGFVLMPSVAVVESGLQARWQIPSIPAAWDYVVGSIIHPVLKRFPKLVEKDERSDCLIQLMEEIVPATPPNTEAWLPNPCLQLTSYWKRALEHDVTDELRREERLHRNESSCVEGLAVDRGFSQYESSERGEGLVLSEVLEALEVLGGDREYLLREATPETLGVAASTFYDRRERAWRRFSEAIPGVEAYRPRRRKKVHGNPE